MLVLTLIGSWALFRFVEKPAMARLASPQRAEPVPA
jgi:peptidoglycan/LPS O-acetylase OafA/YrhL